MPLKSSTSTLTATRKPRAESVMTTKIPIVNESFTVGQTIDYVLQTAHDLETIIYIYVVNEKGSLKGVLSIKDLLANPRSRKIKAIDKKKIVSVRKDTHPEQVAYTALRNNLKAVPVIDKENRLLGAVSADVLLRILDNEAVENFLRFGGVIHRGAMDDVLKIPLTKALKHRLPWLLLGLIGGMLTAGIIQGFEETLSQNLILAAFIPLIVYMADAVGTQMEAFIIRDLANNPKLAFGPYFLKQTSIVLSIGFLTSLFLFGVSFALYREFQICLVLSLALFFSILSSVITGLCIPYTFGKFKLDPANASGPIATIIQDLLSVVAYLSIATLLLN